MHGLDALDQDQRSAVLAEEPQLLVAAGPGSGKTHTLIHRIAYRVLERNVPPGSMVALTFTQKAARELRERVRRVGSSNAEPFEGVWVGTIHARCLHLLREHARSRETEFVRTILDQDAQRDLIEEILEEGVPDLPAVRSGELARILSGFKNGRGEPPIPGWSGFVSAYGQALKRIQALDYDDLLLEALDLAHAGHTEARPLEILVDEYQDINALQHRLIRSWVQSGTSLFAIGDADQSIYGFRGASVEDLLRFDVLYPAARVVTLTTNYRSHRTIVSAGHRLIRHNMERRPLDLEAQRPDGDPIRCVELEDERAEADFIVREIERSMGGSHSLTMHLQGSTGSESEADFSDFAVLTRTHALARPVHAALHRAGFPVKDSARDPVSESKPCRHALDLLRWLWNPSDDAALGSWIRRRGRKEDRALAAALRSAARAHNTTLWETLESGKDPDLAEKQTVSSLKSELSNLRSRFRERTLREMMEEIGEVLGAGSGGEASSSWTQLADASAVYGLGPAAETAGRFLERYLLKNPSEHFDDRAGAVSVLTFHAAKGLEFPIVFLAGVEDGIVPLKRDGADVEEERRLFYVALTRASKRLILTHCRTRFLHGGEEAQTPSPFIGEMGTEGVQRERIKPPRSAKKQKQLTLW